MKYFLILTQMICQCILVLTLQLHTPITQYRQRVLVYASLTRCVLFILRVCIYICVYAYTRRKHTYTNKHAHTPANVSRYMQGPRCVLIISSLHVCKHTYVCTHTHTHTNTHKHTQTHTHTHCLGR